ncbi:MAG TPA: hypothetical protein VMR86_07355 [Myxococcota bacterium]|nr:hypothetical protein [Myxococcota bacterium]
MRTVRLALAFVVAPLVFAAVYWLFLISFWSGAGGYLYSGLSALLVGYPVGFVLVLVGGLPLLVLRLPAWQELAVFVCAGLVVMVFWTFARHGRVVREDLQLFELCAVSSALTYPAFVRLSALRRVA